MSKFQILKRPNSLIINWVKEKKGKKEKGEEIEVPEQWIGKKKPLKEKE